MSAHRATMPTLGMRDTDEWMRFTLIVQGTSAWAEAACGHPGAAVLCTRAHAQWSDVLATNLDRWIRVSLDDELASLDTNAAPKDRLEVVWSYYESVSGLRIERPPTEVQRGEVRAFLQAARCGADEDTMYMPVRRLRLAASLTLAEKAGSLAQAPCLACDVLTNTDGTIPLWLLTPINIDPWSAQSSTDKVAIRQAVAQKLANKPYWINYDSALCVTLVSVLGRRARMKDADNLTKGVLDSLQGLLFKNDKQIQCLTSRVVRHNAENGYFLLSAKGVYPWTADVVSPLDKAEAIVLSERIER